MSLKNQILEQAKLLAGDLDGRKTALLEALCSAASDSLQARLRDSVAPEDCAAEFISAASLYALSDLWDADESSTVEEFRAGDLTVKKGSTEKGASRGLRQQADRVIMPYLKDGFCFSGV